MICIRIKINRLTPNNVGHRFAGAADIHTHEVPGRRLTVADRSGRGLMMAGAIVTFVGLCIVLVKVARVPEYWIPLMVGVGLFLLGLIRWLTRKDM